jgi:hypothetical protein
VSPENPERFNGNNFRHCGKAKFGIVHSDILSIFPMLYCGFIAAISENISRLRTRQKKTPPERGVQARFCWTWVIS